MKVKRRTLRCEVLPDMIPIIPSNLVTSISIKEIYKTLLKDTLEELVEGMRKLTVKISELKKSQRAISLCVSKELKEFIKKYMYCDNFKHKKKDCFNYNEDLKK